MKLLFDENVSAKLADHLSQEFPGSAHVRGVGLRGASDQQIWEHCKAHGFAVVSKDTDFRERGFVAGSPPKIVWLDVGNAGTASIVELLKRERSRVESFDGQAETSVLILSIGPRAI